VKLTKLFLAAALCSFSVGAKANGGVDVANAAYLHEEFTEIMIASDHCPGIEVDMKKWMGQMRAVAGSSGQALVKAFNVSTQGSEWYGKREAEFKADPAKNCAQAEEDYGPNGKSIKGLLVKK
jgi:hypothetical protein